VSAEDEGCRAASACGRPAAARTVLRPRTSTWPRARWP